MNGTCDWSARSATVLKGAMLVYALMLMVSGCASVQEEPQGGSVRLQGQTDVDETLVWSQVMLDAIVAGKLGNPQAMRMAATVNTAMFDARNGVTRKYTPIFVTQAAPPGTHARAAVVEAAYATLTTFYPEQVSRFSKQRESSLAQFAGDDPGEVQRGIEWGRDVARQVLAWRAVDGFANPVSAFTGAGAGVGQWQSATAVSMSPGNIAFTAPFVLASNTQFQWAFRRPWAAVSSPEYLTSLREVAAVGAKVSAVRTLDQTHIAYFFNGYVTNDYVETAIQLAKAHRTGRDANSRIFALLSIALHDTSVTVFRAKRDFGERSSDVTWRPIFAIPKAGLEATAGGAASSGWMPLITTPNHPEYPASHPGSHGAAPRVLQHFFGDVNTFTVHPAFNSVFRGPEEGGVQPRRYSRISDMAQDGVHARTFGGMHFRGASEASHVVGATIADYVMTNAARPVSVK